jgi:hypothetical protein
MRRHDSDRPSDFPPERRERYTRAERVMRRCDAERETYRGDDFTFDLTIRHRNPQFPDACPQPVDLTGYVVWCALKYNFGDPDNQAAAFLSSPSGGVTIVNVPLGLVSVTLPAIATYAFPDGKVRLYSTVKSKSPTGVVLTEEVGLLDVWPSGVAAIS